MLFAVLAEVVLSMALAALAGATLWWQLHAWRTPETLLHSGFTVEPLPPTLRFSLIVPARHEEAVLGTTLDRIARSVHPDVQVLVVVGHDDPGTAAVAEQARARHPLVIEVVVDHSSPKNKPKALLTALPHCTGDVVGVFDAEDDVDPRLLRVVDQAFRDTGADIVQGGVQLVDFRSSWYSLRNCLEYFFWFRSRLHLHARRRFIPLGGNTVFIKTELLRAVGGWDPDCLAEDCEIGVRLSALGATVAVCYDAHLVTREETPHSLRALIKQRTRWNQGFLQVYRKGVWRQLPSRSQRALARWTLAQPFVQAFTGIAIPLSIASMLWLRVPVGVAMLSFLPAIPTLATAAFEITALREFCRVYYMRTRVWDYVVLVAGAPLYQVALSFAAVRAVVREAFGRRGWEKTAHTGAHFAGAAAEADRVPAGLLSEPGAALS